MNDEIMKRNSEEMRLNRRIKVAILVIIGVTSVIIRLLNNYDFGRTSLLYVGIPYFIAFCLLFVYTPEHNPSWKRRYLNLFVMSLIVMLGSSIVLFEGFLCVLMFIPIYFLFVLLAFFAEWIKQRNKQKRGTKIYSNVIPVLVIVTAFEGVFPETSFNRHYSVSRDVVVKASVEDIKLKLGRPIEMESSDHWFLSLFPMPYHVEAGSLIAGDIHKADLQYHRWFLTNTHEGRIELQITKVEEHLIETRFLSDSSYLSNYMTFNGTRIELTPLDGDETQIRLTVNYQRLLDPIWYFGPLQEYAVGLGAELVLEQVISPDAGDLYKEEQG